MNELLAVLALALAFAFTAALLWTPERAEQTHATRVVPIYYVVDGNAIDVAHTIWTDSLILQDEQVLDIIRDMGDGYALCRVPPAFREGIAYGEYKFLRPATIEDFE